MTSWYFPELGESCVAMGLQECDQTSDARFRMGYDGVRSIGRTGDGKVEFVGFATHTLALITSSMGYSAYYPVQKVKIEKPLKAVLMDLDGTTVHSEHFWIWIIEKTTASLLDDPNFKLDAEDEPHVSGHSVSEHLQHCIRKYCPEKSVEEARRWYFKHTNYEMNEILKGRGKKGAFTPSPGIKDFLYELKAMGVKIGLVTSGLYEKAWPEILNAFQTLHMGDPKDFYDAIVTAGHAIRPGEPGTLGELSPKPHPWLYAETARVGLGIPYEERHRVIGIEDSSAGVCSIRLAGFAAFGIGGGNIEQSGTRGLCSGYHSDFSALLRDLKA